MRVREAIAPSPIKAPAAARPIRLPRFEQRLPAAELRFGNGPILPRRKGPARKNGHRRRILDPEPLSGCFARRAIEF